MPSGSRVPSSAFTSRPLNFQRPLPPAIVVFFIFLPLQQDIVDEMEDPPQAILSAPLKRTHEDDVDMTISTPVKAEPSNASTPLSVLSTIPSPSSPKFETSHASPPGSSNNSIAGDSPGPTTDPTQSNNAQPAAKRRKLTIREKEEKRVEKEAKEKAKAEKKAQKELETKLKEEQKAQKDEEKRVKDEERRKKNEEKEEKKKAKEFEQQRKEDERRKKERVCCVSTNLYCQLLTLYSHNRSSTLFSLKQSLARIVLGMCW